MTIPWWHWARRPEPAKVLPGLDEFRDLQLRVVELEGARSGLLARLAEVLQERDRERKRADRLAVEVEQLRGGPPVELVPFQERTEQEREAYWRRRFEQERANNVTLAQRLAKAEGRPC